MAKCDCGEEFHNQIKLEEHKKRNCKNWYFCELCNENVPSSTKDDHLYLCANKTNKCPICSKYVRRGIYLYHLDNNCNDIPEDNTFDREHSFTAKNMQEDDDVLIPCDLCHRQINFSSFQLHIENCLRNQNYRTQSLKIPSAIIDDTIYEQKTTVEPRNSNFSNNADGSSNEPSDIINRSFENMNLNSDENLINTSKDDKKDRGQMIVSIAKEKTIIVRSTLSKDFFPNEIDIATDKLRFNILIVGSPRVGKSQLINALCGKNLAKTSPSLNSCTAKVECYVLEDDQQQTPGVKPFRIYFYDTPGIESWTNQNGKETMFKFIEEKDPVCLIYCASPGTFADLKQLRPVLDFCKTKQIFCALVCTNMWSSANRRVVLEEFEKELSFFGERVEKSFSQGYIRSPHKVIFFGNGALCTMVNSIEYYDPEISSERKPVQGIDELIHSIMEKLDHDKVLGWCNAVLCRRSYWEKVTQKVSGFALEHLSNVPNMTIEQTAIGFALHLFKMLINRKEH